jgi:hypothetical protein
MTSNKDKQMPQSNRSSSTQQTQHNHDQDDESIGNDEWHPTPETFEKFLSRDFVLAVNNIRLAMVGSRPMTLRDLKESCLHSNDVIERVLSAKIANGTVKEEKGRYSLVV